MLNVMTGKQLVEYRKQNKLTQVEAAHSLGLSQTYLSLLEGGKRSLTNALRKKAVRVFGLQPTEMPADNAFMRLSQVSDEQLRANLTALGYKGFSYLKPSPKKNPAVVLLSALKSDNREARLVEALPWLVLTFPNMDWNELIKAAKVNDLQNRLGFVASVARSMAELAGDKKTAVKLKRRESELERSLLFHEDTLCNASMTNAERKWLTAHRSEAARHWRLLTNLSPESLNYAG